MNHPLKSGGLQEGAHASASRHDQTQRKLRYQGVFKFVPARALPACRSTTPGLNICMGEGSAQEKVPPDNLVEAHITLARGGSL